MHNQIQHEKLIKITPKETHGKLFFIVASLAIPVKLITDILSHLHNIPIPSSTNLALLLAIPAIIIGKPTQETDKKIATAFYIFLIFIILSILIQLTTPSHKSIFSEPATTALATSAVLFLIYLIAGINYKYNKEKFYKICLSSLAGCSATIIITQLFYKDVWVALNESGAYLRVGDVFSVVSIIALVSTKNNYLKAIITLTSITSLLYIGSRSSLFTYLVSIAIHFALLLSRENIYKKKTFATAAVAMLLASTIYIQKSEYIKEQFDTSRIGYTLTSSEEKISGLSVRTELLNRGIDRITENPFYGNLLRRIYDDNSGGQYIHNFLFILDDFGIFPFTAFAFIVATTSVRILKNPENRHLIPILIFCLISMSISRAYAFPYIFFLASAALPKART